MTSNGAAPSSTAAAIVRIELKLDTVIEEFKARDGRTADLELRTRKLENRVDRLTRRGRWLQRIVRCVTAIRTRF